MSVLYIAGTEQGVGATALAAATARCLAGQGRSVALAKPLRLVDEGAPPSPIPTSSSTPRRSPASTVQRAGPWRRLLPS